MSVQRKNEEVQFYLDRSKESVITIIKSILGNPRLSHDEQCMHMRAFAEHHASIAQFIEQRLADGKKRAAELKAAAGI